MTGMLGTAFFPDETLQSMDENTAVYCASNGKAGLSLTRDLLTTLQNAASDGAPESLRFRVDGSNACGGRSTALEVLQLCCMRWWECRSEVEEEFLQVCYSLRTIGALTGPEIGIAPTVKFLADLFAGVPGTVGGRRLAEALHVERSWLSLADLTGLPLAQQRKGGAPQLLPGMSLLERTLGSFRVVTDEILPSYLYCTIQPLFCAMMPSWLLNGIFADTQLQLIGTEEGIKIAKQRLDLHVSSLRFLLELAEDYVGRDDTATALEQKKSLEEMLLWLTAMQSTFTEDWLLEQVTSEWPSVMGEARNIIAGADSTSLGVPPEQIMEAFAKLFQLPPHRVTDHIVHCFELPLTSVSRDDEVGRKMGEDEVPTVVAAVGVSFDGMSLGEVEYLLQPSDADEASPIQTGGESVSARIYTYFYRRFKLLLRACCLQEAQVVVMLWPFFDLQASPFLRSVPPARLATMLRCHSYAFFDALVVEPWGITAALVLGGGWVRATRAHFVQWLSERRGERGQLPIVIFKQLWKENGNSNATNSAQQALCIPLLQRIVTGSCSTLVNTKVAVLVPAGSATVLSRRYSVFPLLRHPPFPGENGTIDEILGEGTPMNNCTMVDSASRPLLAALLQGTPMPVLSYSVCGPVPIPYVCDDFN
ncbi:uncharacterized protein Tco025E_02027 [Trypanosoma conorhini]|uniref:Uncharacterized protein n=1 Tax=Trypanosoma conorhini TaxID=83891 RepID=A0A422Q6Z7_9TRYP|nr:uncharacterized protein Tco025E_02027 [Trypanosoma conorhini]RNF25728.1 hypothetical protein Tco025E_02027 [Trypanosoma conorhini]